MTASFLKMSCLSIQLKTILHIELSYFMRKPCWSCWAPLHECQNNENCYCCGNSWMYENGRTATDIALIDWACFKEQYPNWNNKTINYSSIRPRRFGYWKEGNDPLFAEFEQEAKLITLDKVKEIYELSKVEMSSPSNAFAYCETL